MTPSRVRCGCGVTVNVDLARPLFRRFMLPPWEAVRVPAEQKTSFDYLAEGIAPSTPTS